MSFLRFLFPKISHHNMIVFRIILPQWWHCLIIRHSYPSWRGLCWCSKSIWPVVRLCLVLIFRHWILELRVSIFKALGSIKSKEILIFHVLLEHLENVHSFMQQIVLRELIYVVSSQPAEEVWQIPLAQSHPVTKEQGHNFNKSVSIPNYHTACPVPQQFISYQKIVYENF